MSERPVDRRYPGVYINRTDSELQRLGPPPAYASGGGMPPTALRGGDLKEESYSRRDPRNWSRRCWILLILAIVAVLAIAIAIAVVAVRQNRYPDYSKLNYSLVATYSGTGFFDNFNYFTGYDPAQGLVHYVDSVSAGISGLNLTYATASSAILRVDTSTTDTTTGRKSVRIESKSTFDNGLFIFDVIHSPYGCSTWPALWMTNRYDWPTDGEIDIMEATNAANVGNQMTLHTTDGCSMSSVKRKETGSVLNTNCWNGTDYNAGCGVRGEVATFGQEFNDNGGGVYAMELRDAGIRVWFFDRSSIPSDISSTTSSTPNSTAAPDPSTWGEALADFPSTDCDISSHFQNQSIIADIDLCGQWAGLSQYYNTQSDCPGTCVDYVSFQPGSAYDEAYWEFGGWWVWQSV